MKKNLLVVMLLCAGMMQSCSKDDNDDANNNGNNSNTGNATVRMHLKDGPADYDAIYLDVKSVELKMTGRDAVILDPIRPGIYDLLRLQNGLDTLLVTTTVPAGDVEQIRLILGPNNTIVVDGNTYDLGTPSAQESGVKLNLNQTLVAGGSYDIWLDFDAGKSILQTGNGKYKLKPVIRAYSALTDGRIKGYVLPLAAFTTVYAINGPDTFTAIPNISDGFYYFSGLPSGNYDVLFDAGPITYRDTMVNNVQVSYGTEANLGVMTLTP